VDLRKLDVEGADELVLTDSERQDKLQYIGNIVCEYHRHHRGVGSDHLSRTLAILEKAGFGYQLHAYRGRSPRQFFYQDVLIYAHRKESRGA